MPPLKNLYNIPRILEWELYLVGILPEACLVSESAAALGAIRADKCVCRRISIYIRPQWENHFLILVKKECNASELGSLDCKMDIS